MKAAVLACVVAWLSSTVKCEYIAGAVRNLWTRRRHWKQGKAVALSPKHMEPRGEGLYRAGGGSGSHNTDHECIRGAAKLLII